MALHDIQNSSLVSTRNEFLEFLVAVVTFQLQDRFLSPFLQGIGHLAVCLQCEFVAAFYEQLFSPFQIVLQRLVALIALIVVDAAESR